MNNTPLSGRHCLFVAGLLAAAIALISCADKSGQQAAPTGASTATPDTQLPIQASPEQVGANTRSTAPDVEIPATDTALSPARAAQDAYHREISLEADHEIPSGRVLSVEWTGPGGGADYIAVADAAMLTGAQYHTYAYVREGNPLVVPMPETPGDYELRYVQGTSGAILARRKVVVSTVTAGLEADAEVPSGRALAISWTGPANPGDYIAVADHSMVEGSRYLASNAITGDNPLILTMPDAPGEYELRYVQGQSHTILARQPTTVLSATASLEADAQIPSGRTLVVDWTGPNNQRDYISVAEASMPESGYLAYTYVENGNPLELNMPDAPGDYELRYVQGQSNTVLARRPVQVSPVSARVVANAQVPAGGTVNVAWQGPANLKDYLAIVDVGATDAVAYHSQVAATGNNELQLIAPDQPGDYTIAYVQGQSKTILARQPLEVTPVAASLDYAADPVVGKELAVSWTGPANNRDYISVALPGSDDAAYLAYQYTKTGNPIVLTLPAAPGKYELRYVQGQSHTAIARRAITVGFE